MRLLAWRIQEAIFFIFFIIFFRHWSGGWILPPNWSSSPTARERNRGVKNSEAKTTTVTRAFSSHPITHWQKRLRSSPAHFGHLCIGDGDRSNSSLLPHDHCSTRLRIHQEAPRSSLPFLHKYVCMPPKKPLKPSPLFSSSFQMATTSFIRISSFFHHIVTLGLGDEKKVLSNCASNVFFFFPERIARTSTCVLHKVHPFLFLRVDTYKSRGIFLVPTR